LEVSVALMQISKDKRNFASFEQTVPTNLSKQRSLFLLTKVKQVKNKGMMGI
jgi:hypothetical protein